MRHLLTGLLSAACALAVATDALACREFVPRADKLAAMAPVMVTVTHSERLDTPGWNTWRVTAHADGSAAPATLQFMAALSSDGCGQTPLPPAGERWVVYLDRADSSNVLQAFPIDYVREYDVRLTAVR
jgi:hypothetical protein